MAKSCDICQASLGFFKFRYAEGFLCKTCYKAASRNYRETICQKSYSEIAEICRQEKIEQKAEDLFEVTNRIGDFLLLDKKNLKFCLVNNPRVMKEYKKPEIYEYQDFVDFKIICKPEVSFEELEKMQLDKNCEQVIQSLCISLFLKKEFGKKEIKIISTPMRVKSYAFQRSFIFAKRIAEELNKIKKD